MSNYDFDTIIDRTHSNSLKWDVAEGELPMWVADMDFKTAPEITEAIQERAAQGHFGYSIIPDEWTQAYQYWWKTRYNFQMESDWLIFSTGVIPAISSMVRKLTTPAEKVLLLTPVYNIFYNSILNNGRVVLESPLALNGTDFEVDFEDFEKKASDPQCSLMILCNPQNPVGKIWDKETLERIGNICAKYNVTVISDEVHGDLTSPGHTYVPFQSVSETNRIISVACLSPSKTFNLAGLHSAAVSVPNPALRHKVWRGLNTDEVAEPNAFAIQSSIAAYTKGAQWVDELRAYLEENKKLVTDYLAQHIPDITVIPQDATYLMWLDVRKITMDDKGLASLIRKETGLFLTRGSAYGEAGTGFLRLNVACPKSVVEDGLKRLEAGIKAWKAQ